MADQVDMRCLMLGVMLDRYVQEIKYFTAPDYIADVAEIWVSGEYESNERAREMELLELESYGIDYAETEAYDTTVKLVRDVKDTIDTAVRLGCLPGADVLSDVNADLTAISAAIQSHDLITTQLMARQMVNKLHNFAYKQSTHGGQ